MKIHWQICHILVPEGTFEVTTRLNLAHSRRAALRPFLCLCSGSARQLPCCICLWMGRKNATLFLWHFQVVIIWVRFRREWLKTKRSLPCVYTNNQVRCSVRATPAACTVMTYHGSRAEPNKHRAPAHKTSRGRQTRPHLNSSCATTHIHFEDKPSQHSSGNSPLIPAVPQRAHWQSEDYFTAVFPVFTDSELLRSWCRPETSLWHPFSNFYKFTASASYKRKATPQIKSRFNATTSLHASRTVAATAGSKRGSSFSASTYKLSIKLY